MPDFASILVAAVPVLAEPVVITDTSDETLLDTPWRVILFDDDIHTFEDVILQLMKATGCSEQQGEKHAWTVHTLGKDLVYEGEFFECFRVLGVLREVQLVTEIEG